MRPDQEATFRQQGCLYLRGALEKRLVQPVKAHVLDELKRLNIWSAGRTLSARLKGIPAFQQVDRLGKLIRYPSLQDRLITQELRAIMRHLAGTGLSAAQDTQLLLSLPHNKDWTLERLNWHRDVAHSQSTPIPGIQIFVLIDDLAPRGGATLALAGSHRLQGRARQQQSMDQLINRVAAGNGVTDGVELSILEMTGRSGDVYLMDMRLLHTPSINASRNVRMMATTRYFTA